MAIETIFRKIATLLAFIEQRNVDNSYFFELLIEQKQEFLDKPNFPEEEVKEIIKKTEKDIKEINRIINIGSCFYSMITNKDIYFCPDIDEQ